MRFGHQKLAGGHREALSVKLGKKRLMKGGQKGVKIYYQSLDVVLGIWFGYWDYGVVGKKYVFRQGWICANGLGR